MAASSIHADPPPGIVLEPSGIQYLTGIQLGKGGFAICYKAEVCQNDRRTGHTVALKIVKSQMPYDKLAQKFVTELQLHSKMHHPNIVEFFRAFAFGPSTYVVLEICEKGSLADVLRRRKFVSMPEIRRFLIQTCGAVKYLHARHIVHRDLKTGNLFLDRNMNIKVGDFGLAAVVVSKNDIGHRRTTMCGTPNYLAPEILEKSGRGHNEKVDLWAIGIIAYTLAVGKAPFHAQQREEIYKRLQNRDYRWPLQSETANETSPDLEDLVGSLLVHEDDRPSPDTIVSHKFFKLEYVPDKLDPASTHKAPVFKIPQKSREALNRGFSSSWFLMCKMSGVGEVSAGRCFPVLGGRKMPSIIRECEREIEAGRYPVIPFPDAVVYEPLPSRPNFFNTVPQPEAHHGPEEDVSPLVETSGNEGLAQKRTIGEGPRRGRGSKENSDPASAYPEPLGHHNPPRKNSSRGAPPITGRRVIGTRSNQSPDGVVASARTLPPPVTSSLSDPPDRQQTRETTRDSIRMNLSKPLPSRDTVSGDLSSRMKALSTHVTRKLNPSSERPEEDAVDPSRSKAQPRYENRKLDVVRARIKAAISSTSRSRSRSRSLTRNPEPTGESYQSRHPSVPQGATEALDLLSTHPPISNSSDHSGPHRVGPQADPLISAIPPTNGFLAPTSAPFTSSNPSHDQLPTSRHSQQHLDIASTVKHMTDPIVSSAPTAAKEGDLQSFPEMVKIPHSDTESVISRIVDLQKSLQSALDEANIAPCRVVRSPRLPYVSKWIDYSKRDGVGYVLEDGTVGCIQNAAPPQPVQFTVVRNGYNRLIEIRRDPRIIETMALEYFADFGKHGVRSVYIAPHRRKASCSCWKRFGTFMFQKMLQQESLMEPPKQKSLDLGLEEDTIEEEVPLVGGPFVRFYQRLGNVGIWGFQDGTFQFNFPDHTKLVVSADGRHCNFLCLSHRGTREMLEKGTITADLIQEREMLPMTVQSLLSPAAVHHPQASLAPANIFHEKIQFIVTVLAEWIFNGAVGKLSPDSRYLQWTGRQVQDGMNKLDWSTVGASGGDGEKYSVTLPAVAAPTASSAPGPNLGSHETVNYVPPATAAA